MEHQAVLKTLLNEVGTATEMARVANEQFQSVIKEAPSGFPAGQTEFSVYITSLRRIQKREGICTRRASSWSNFGLTVTSPKTSDEARNVLLPNGPTTGTGPRLTTLQTVVLS